jgi:hypothetical protein
MSTRISILIRSMDRPTLERALQSVAAQTRRPDEILVVSAKGCGHRPLPSELNAIPLRLIEPGQPLQRADAGNALLAAAEGDWLNFLDDDDEFLPNHLQTLAAVVEQDSAGLAVVHSVAEVIDAEGRVRQHLGAPFQRLRQLDCGFIASFGTALFARRLLDEGVALDEHFPILEDMDFWIQCAARGRMHFVDQVTYRYHAADGESGIGLGNHRDAEGIADALRRLRIKWSDLAAEIDASPAQRLLRAQQALQSGEDASALRLLRDLLAELPQDVNVLNLTAVAELRIGALDRAGALLQAALRIAPGQPAIRANLQLVQQKLRERAAERPGAATQSPPPPSPAPSARSP